MIEPQWVSDVDDERGDDYRDLTDVGLRKRREPALGLFMAESHQVIGRALAAGYEVRSILTTPRWMDAVADLALPAATLVLVADEPVVNAITGYRVHRGALAAMERRPLAPVEQVLRNARRILVLEGIVDHTNVGAMFRSAAGLGFDACLIDPTCADPLSRRSVRVSMGTVFAMPWTRVENWPTGLADLRRDGFELLALTPRPGATSLRTIAANPPERLALLFGTEGDGLTRACLEAVTQHVRIPMAHSVDSLNVAAAAAVACYALAATREQDDRMLP
jgi:tRNA G18 (ribose-2'-O)-methylase SpoU